MTMIKFEFASGRLYDPETGMTFADRTYRYDLTGQKGDGASIQEVRKPTAGKQDQGLRVDPAESIASVLFEKLGLELQQAFKQDGTGLEETISLKNIGNVPVRLSKIEIGFCAGLDSRPNWRLCAIPFKVQLDGTRHDYTVQALVNREFKNAVFDDFTRRFMPALKEEDLLRSEAWAWGVGDQGVVVIKYNNQEIELSIASPFKYGNENALCFGGAGLCLYGEPSGALQIGPGQTFVFGPTLYIPYQGGLDQAYKRYRDFLDQKGHTFPVDYDPPVNWNELYDVGWYHSNPEELKQHYTRAALLKEAQKAKEVGCELLYLDPGWEVCEGTTLWDESRLGSVKDLVATLKNEYGLGLGYRTILRTYQDHWPKEFLIDHGEEYQPVEFGGQYFWEPCLCDSDFWSEKLKRILEISKQGVRFMMIDEMDWRGPCYNTSHGHPVPTTPLDHSLAVYRLSDAIRKACPGLTIETHDPVWPWNNSIYVPTYFKHGFGEKGSYDENWGFEYMWDCLNDLKSGRALALYYYNLGCNVPIYLHITMAADNDACVFFWWVASTVRHVGIGGKQSSKTIEPPQGLPARDVEKRFADYKNQMKIYQSLKAYYVRGSFSGINETAHLHTLKGRPGGVLNLFNLTEEEQEIDVFVPLSLLEAVGDLPVSGAQAVWTPDGVNIHLKMKAMSPAVVTMGEAAGLINA
jgi:hypothetical protein